jgi:ATP-dependent Clp protease adapter protein ClpS
MAPRSGFVRLLTIRGVPVYVHWSFPMGGILVASFGRVDPRQWVYYCFAYTLLIVVHECGHLLAGKLLKLRVFSVEVSGLGGRCRFERPQQVWQGVVLYSGGLLAQAATLLLAMSLVSVFGHLPGALGRALEVTFIFINLGLLVINLIPIPKRRGGVASDGWVLWRLFLHTIWGRAHPLPTPKVLSAAESPVFPPETRLLEHASLRPAGFVQGVEILNDRTTPMEFVVTVLMKHVGLSREKAIETMLSIHNSGGILIALPTPQEATRVASAISADATAAGFSFVCRYASA